MPLPTPGVYVLSRDVANPHPDRRSKDWQCKPVLPKGLRLVVRGIAPGVEMTMDPSRNLTSCEVGRYQGYFSQYIKLWPEDCEASGGKWHALCMALEPETGPERVFAGPSDDLPEPDSAYYILRRLLAEGLVSPEEVLAAHAANQAEPE